MSQQPCASIPQRKGTPDEQRKQLSVCKACGSKMIFRQVASNKVLVFCSSKKCLFPLDSEELTQYILPLRKVKNRAASLSLSFSSSPSDSPSPTVQLQNQSQLHQQQQNFDDAQSNDFDESSNQIQEEENERNEEETGQVQTLIQIQPQEQMQNMLDYNFFDDFSSSSNMTAGDSEVLFMSRPF